MNLLAELNRAMEYIEAHIDDDEALASVEHMTGYPPLHFNRVFGYIAGMPLTEYIRRRKLSLAAMDLQKGDERIIDIAVKYGYNSADSFARAFYKQHGIMPSAARRIGTQLNIYPPMSFQISIRGADKMNWRIEEREAFKVFGVERLFKNDEIGKVPEFWRDCHADGSYERLFDAAGGERYPDGRGKVRADGTCVILALCCYEESDGAFPYMLCAEMTDGTDACGYKVVSVPKRTWTVFRSEESHDIGKAIPQLFSRAYSEWLPTSGYDRAPGPELEVYGVAPSGKYFEEVWIPVVRGSDLQV